MQKKILITGGAGFIGLNLTEKLLELGHEVYSVDNFVTSEREKVSEFLNHEKYHFEEQDITCGLGKFATIPFDEIYHLACPTGVDNLLRLGEEMIMTSSLGTKNVLEVAHEHGSTVVYTSSSEVYGEPEKSPQRESYTGNVSPVGMRSPYEEGKRIGETLVMLYVRKYKVHGIIARVFNTYGPRMGMRDSRVIPKFISSIKKNDALPIHGDGSQVRTFCYVDDLVDGLVILANRGVKGGVYNLGSQEQIKIRELAYTVRKIYGNGLKFKKVKRPIHDHSSRLPDTRKIEKLGWREKVSLSEGLRRVLWNLQ